MEPDGSLCRTRRDAAAAAPPRPMQHAATPRGCGASCLAAVLVLIRLLATLLVPEAAHDGLSQPVMEATPKQKCAQLRAEGRIIGGSERPCTLAGGGKGALLVVLIISGRLGRLAIHAALA